MKNDWLDKSNYSKASDVNFILSGNQYFAELETLINSAKSEILIQVYIIESDETGFHFLDLLKKAAERNIKVLLLADAYGSGHISNKRIHDLEKAGVSFRFFSPLFQNKRLTIGRRLHNKLIVIDGEKAIVGGINIADKYRDTTKHKGWLDYAVVVEGNIALHLMEYFYKIWNKRLRRYKISESKVDPKTIFVRYSENDWLRSKNEIRHSYYQSLREAKHSIIIIGAYFLPNTTLKSLLRKATKRGVDVKIIMSGISDVRFIVAAQHYFYNDLIQNNIKIYEWNESVVHGKVAVVDGKWMTIGSYNMNYLSTYGNIELNVDILNKEKVSFFKHHIENEILPKCQQINKSDLMQYSNFLKRINRWFSYQFIRLSMILAVSFFKRNK